MNCAEFTQNWNSYISDTLDDSTKTSMAEHARICHECGKKWEEHKELSTTITSVLETPKLPSNIASRVAETTYQEQFGANVSLSPAGSSRNSPWNTSMMPVLFAVLLGGLIGYLLAGQGSQNNLAQQLNYAQMLGSRGGGRNSMEAMLYAQMMGISPGGSNMFGGQGLFPQMTSAIRIIFLICLLVWLARTRIWEALFPSRLPGGVYVARWLALLAAIIGLMRCGCSGYMTMQFFTGASGPGGYGGPVFESWLLPTAAILDQLWSIGFWLTLFVILFTVVNQVSLRYVRQLQQNSKTTF